MELLRKFSRIRKIELEIQTLNEDEYPSMFRFSILFATIFCCCCLVYENNPQRYAEMIQDKLLDLLEQAFPNPMFVNDLAKSVFLKLLTKKKSFPLSQRYLECDSQIVFDNLVILEQKNLVKHLDHDDQQWTRVIVTAEEENTHST